MERLFLSGAAFARSCGIPFSDALGRRLHHISRVGIVGGVGFLIQSSVFEIFGMQLGWLRPSTAALLGGEAALLIIFALNDRLNFKGRDAAPAWRRLLVFHAVVSGSLLLQWGTVNFAEQLLASPLQVRAAFLVGVLFGFASNYIGYHLFVWHHQSR